MIIINDPMTCRIVFPSISRRGPHTQTSGEIRLPESFTMPAAVLVGFKVGYGTGRETSPGADRHFGEVEIDLQVRRVGTNSVQVEGRLALRDWSVNRGSAPWDDPYYGEIRFAIIAD